MSDKTCLRCGATVAEIHQECPKCEGSLTQPLEPKPKTKPKGK